MSRSSRSVSRARPGGETWDRLGVLGDILQLVFRRKLWWFVPVLIALFVLAVLLMLEATPVGPLIYPLF